MLAHDWLEAVRRATSFQPELVLLDLAMPRMAGYEAAPKLRKVVVPNPLIVAVSGYGREEDRQRCAEADFDLHLLKPVAPGVLEGLPLLIEHARRGNEKLIRLSSSVRAGLRELVSSQLDMAHTFLRIISTTSVETTRQRCQIKLWRIYDRISGLPGVDDLGIENELELLRKAARAVPRDKASS
jgi:CheY-like chemotaxis protein